jgi:hypothetical protein
LKKFAARCNAATEAIVRPGAFFGTSTGLMWFGKLRPDLSLVAFVPTQPKGTLLLDAPAFLR